MVANSDNTDQIFLRELSVLDYLFAISSQSLNSVSDSECIRLQFSLAYSANLDQTIPSRAF